MRARPYPGHAELIRRAIALDPLPPRTDPLVQHVGSSDGHGWVRRTISFESQPGVRLPASVYTPIQGERHPLVVALADSWERGRCSPWMQALGIALAAQGFFAVLLDPPGVGDRSAMGDPFDPSLSAAISAAGVGVWDTIRAIDVAISEYGADPARVACLGVGSGAEVAILAAAVDERIGALVAVCGGHSQEGGISGAFQSLPGVADLGDWANLIVHRAPMPMLFLSAEANDAPGVEKTVSKLRSSYKGKDTANKLSSQTFLGGRDLNRRMREAAAAFFREHLMAEPCRLYVPEPIPLTDSEANPFPANTEDPNDLSTPVPTLSFAELRDRAMSLPYPHAHPEMIPWGKYGRLEPLPEMEVLQLCDHGDAQSKLVLPMVDPTLLISLGMSVPDFYAQLLHQLLPGGPEGWEPLALQGDALSAMIASVRTLMKKVEAKEPPRQVIARGPVASLTARLLHLSRPGLHVECDTDARSWQDVLAQGILVPGARYRPWPWPAPSVLAEREEMMGGEMRSEEMMGEEMRSDEMMGDEITGEKP